MTINDAIARTLSSTERLHSLDPRLASDVYHITLALAQSLEFLRDLDTHPLPTYLRNEIHTLLTSIDR